MRERHSWCANRCEIETRRQSFVSIYEAHVFGAELSESISASRKRLLTNSAGFLCLVALTLIPPKQSRQSAMGKRGKDKDDCSLLHMSSLTVPNC